MTIGILSSVLLFKLWHDVEEQCFTLKIVFHRNDSEELCFTLLVPVYYVFQKWLWGSIRWRRWGWWLWWGRTQRRRQEPGKETITNRTTFHVLRRKFTSRACSRRLRSHFQTLAGRNIYNVYNNRILIRL